MNPSELGLKVTDLVLDPATHYYIGSYKAEGSIIRLLRADK
jgi:hypothetical protein